MFLHLLCKERHPETLDEQMLKCIWNEQAGFRDESPFGSARTEASFYKKLSRLCRAKACGKEYNADLYYLYDYALKPDVWSWFPSLQSMIGGIFDLELESSDNDDFFYQWLLSGEMRDGEIVVHEGDYQEVRARIKFWDCYCVEVGESMSALDSRPMWMRLRLSPGITVNRGVKHEKTWRVTDPFEKIDYYKRDPDLVTEVAEIEMVTPVKVNPHTHRRGLECGQTYKLKVKSYTNGTPNSKDDIRWEYRYVSNQGGVVVGSFKDQRGPEVEYTVDDYGAVGNVITFYAYIAHPNQGGRHAEFVNPLYYYKGTKQWGALGKGLERVSETKTLEELRPLLDKKGYDRAYMLSVMSEEFVWRLYSESVFGSVKEVLSDDDNIQERVLFNFRTGREPKLSFGLGSIQSQKLHVNPTFQEYFKRYLEVVKKMIIPKRVIETLNGDDIAKLFGNENSYKEKCKPNFSVINEILDYDYYGLMGGTQKISVDLEVIQTDLKTYLVKTLMRIGDWYGSDQDDINGGGLKSKIPSLNAFFWLQHHYGYHPFETEIVYESIDLIKNESDNNNN
jgi:hypothetical protein